MSDLPPTAFDFDEWAELAQSDPDTFEIRRAALVNATIDQAPEERRQRLRCLQWKIDQVRRLAPSPERSCERISRMMQDSLTGPEGLVKSIERLGRLLSSDDVEAEPRHTAVVRCFDSHVSGSRDSVHRGPFSPD